ncbi:MAG: hypothetical protein R3Y63_08880 [Eubacteriales bacterium]
MSKTNYRIDIVKDIMRDDVSDEEKGLAIMKMLEFKTLNHINKDELVEIIRYLFPLVFDLDVEDDVPDTNVGNDNREEETT